MKYSRVVCGGTFDLLHSGHKSFLGQIFNFSDKVVIGLTSDKYTNIYKTEISENFKTRKQNLLEFLGSTESKNRAEIISIDDVYGPLLNKNFVVEVIVATEQTNKSAIEINEKRTDLGLRPLEILILKMDTAADGGLISSTRIRNGEIDRSGKLFVNPDWKRKTFVLPDNLREEFHKPFGKLIKGLPRSIDPGRTITVGDITTQKFNSRKVGQRLSIIDFIVERRKKFDQISDLGFLDNLKTVRTDNPAGQISWDLFRAIIDSFKDKKRKIILVNGEEDLAVLPTVLSAPLGYKIYYGQPKEGLVEVEVTEESKERASNLIDNLKVS